MSTAPNTCADCGAPLGYRNTSGYCGRHVGAANMRRPGAREYQVQRLRYRYASDPQLCQANAARLAKARKLRDPDELRRQWVERKPWIAGNAAQPAGSESRKRMAASISATRLAWCPSYLRDEYRALTAKGMKAAEARTLILEQHEVNMRRWRRSVGIEPPPAVVVAVRRGLLFIDRASAVAAEWAGVADLWGNGRGGNLSRARWAVFLALRRGGWTANRIANEVGMDHNSVGYGLRRAEILAAAPGEFSDLFRKVCAA